MGSIFPHPVHSLQGVEMVLYSRDCSLLVSSFPYSRGGCFFLKNFDKVPLIYVIIKPLSYVTVTYEALDLNFFFFSSQTTSRSNVWDC